MSAEVDEFLWKAFLAFSFIRKSPKFFVGTEAVKNRSCLSYIRSPTRGIDIR